MKRFYLSALTALCLVAPVAGVQAATQAPAGIVATAEEPLTLGFRSNRLSTIVNETTPEMKFTATTNKEATIRIYCNDTLLGEQSGVTTLQVPYKFNSVGDYIMKAVATADGETLEQQLVICFAAPSQPASDTTIPAMGVTKNSDNTYTFCFAAPEKESVMLVGEWNGYAPMNAYNMEYVDKTVDGFDLRYFKITLPASTTGNSFGYYYYVDAKTAVADPYCRLVLDPYNDKYISSEVFPDMPEYPSGVPTNTLISIYRDDLLDYEWNVKDFKGASKDNLVIYELLFRDFTGTEGAAKGDGTVRQAIEKIPYLKELGINAVELLPINEFNGNNSWGYNPNFYFAPDKAYGTPQDYKEFIDRCHEEGIAVILDVVFNQSDGLHPWYKMYSIDENPFYNKTSPHAYSVLNDWRQEYPLVEQQWKDMLQFWLSEYKVDGFRFDLVKGLGDNSSYNTSSESNTNAYNSSRVARMTRLHAAMSEVNPDAYFINENLATQKEENEMAADGQLNWANVNNAACQFAMGYSSDSNMNRMWAVKDSSRTPGSTVAYCESHDEERMGYKQDTWGVAGVKGNTLVSTQRLAGSAAQMILMPGSHMIWQFGEVGNNQSTKKNTGENNTGAKIVNWSILEQPEYKALYDTYAGLISFRLKNADLFDESADFSVNCAVTNWAKGRSIFSTTADKEMYVVINPNTAAGKNITMQVPFRSDNNADYKIAGMTYQSNPTFDAAAKTITVEPHCFVIVTTNNAYSGVESVGTDSFSDTMIFGSNGAINVRNASGNVEVYSLNGSLVASTRVEGNTSVEVVPGVYVVRAAGKTAKVIVR